MEVQGIKLSMPGSQTVGRLSLRTKILWITGLSGGLVAGILSAVFLMQMRDALRAELATRARVISIQMANHLAPDVAAVDLPRSRKRWTPRCAMCRTWRTCWCATRSAP
ncbi:hypothetical protein [Stigmatella aurantiaca]|uniref:hypothetical protein n=1 Tax=Stigmatella aurantiaca TaxID=41 RepID=UPI001E285C89|nr:hypothetical protein [Stigmatella aurantiaca]